jgi:hypothetical protein
MKHSLYALADWASWATILGLPVLVIGLFISARSAVSSRQRDLGERLRKVLRCVSKACDDYAYADRRNAVAVAFRDAAEQLDEIHDEGILSPNRPPDTRTSILGLRQFRTGAHRRELLHLDRFYGRPPRTGHIEAKP